MDTAKGEIARTVKVPGPVHHVVVTPDGRFAVSTHPMGGGISVVSGGRRDKELPVSRPPRSSGVGL